MYKKACGIRYYTEQSWHRQRREEYRRNLRESLGRDPDSEFGSEIDQIGVDSGDDREGDEPTLKEMREMGAIKFLISKLGENPDLATAWHLKP